MNPGEKEEMLHFIDEIGAHLQDDQAVLDHKVLQTQDDIERLEGRAEALKLKKAEIFVDRDDDEAVEAIDSIGALLTHLEIAIAHLEHKRDVLKMALRCVDSATGELHGFNNALPGIPNLD